MQSIVAFSIAFAGGIGLVLPTSLEAQVESQRATEALRIINQHIATVCHRPNTIGNRTTVSANAKIDANIKGLIGKLVDVGGEVGANAERVNWDGVAQEQMAQAIDSGNKCSIRMTELLLPLLMPVPVTAVDSTAGASKTTKPSQARYAVRGSYGFVRWDSGLFPTPDACSARIGMARASDCRRLPERLVCAYESRDGSPLYPVCYWALQECESEYKAITEYLAQRSEVRVSRVACEETDWADAAKRYETWRKPPGKIRIRPVVVSTACRTISCTADRVMDTFTRDPRATEPKSKFRQLPSRDTQDVEKPSR